MNIKIFSLVVDEQFIQPTLKIGIEIEYKHSLQVPLVIGGHIMSGGKIVSQLIESSIGSDTSIGLKFLDGEKKEKILATADSKYAYTTFVTAVLNEKSINYINEFREKQSSKSVQFDFNFLCKYLISPIELDKLLKPDSSHFLALKVERPYANFEIKHSEWVNNFAPKLGLGNFLLVELRIPDELKVPPFWNSLYSVLASNVKGMENTIREGDWQKTMLFGRKYFENLKIGDSKPGHKAFKKEFEVLLKKDQHSEEGINNFYDGTWKFFEFISKFIHDKDKNGNLSTLPIPTKEDAYFAYSMALSLLNLIGKKLSEN